MDSKRLLANKIKARLKELGMQRIQFAALMKVQPSVVSRWLNGSHNFQVFTLFEIERVLNLPLFHYNTPEKQNQFIDEFI